jgi:predicted HAD superfamily phosphohydrolase YqeG
VIRLRRVARVISTSNEDVHASVSRLAPRTLVLDVEPLICRWRSEQRRLEDGLRAMLSRIGDDHPGIERVVFLTNSGRKPAAPPRVANLAATYVSKARKPWLRLTNLRAAPVPLVVVGDQVLTDGILAWRLNATFVQVPIPVGAPFAVRCQRLLGDMLAVLLFAA